MDWNEWQLFDLILLDKLQCSSNILLLITQFLTQTGNHTVSPCSPFFFLNCDLWLKDVIFLHNFWVFLWWMVWYPYFYHTISSVSSINLDLWWKILFIILNMKQLMNSDYVYLIAFPICCCLCFCQSKLLPIFQCYPEPKLQQ